MTPPLSDALELSRRTTPNAASLPIIFAAEASIGRMNDPAWSALQQQLAAVPGDGFLWLWNGLVLAHRGDHGSACQHFAESIERGCSHWRIGWYIAQAARKLGTLELVDSACAAVLKANPEFWFAREFPKHARGYYAQLGQDKILETFFQTNPPRARRFVEVGAFDGVHYSNVRRLHEAHGWTGLCIEPVSKNFKKLSASYQGSDVRCIQAAVSSQDGQLDIHVSHYPHLPDWGSDVASVGGADQERWTKRYGAEWTLEKVPSRRLTRLLDEAGIDDFDLLSIDAEGHDLEVLASLDFERFQPQAIVIEFGVRKAEVLRFLEAQGYSVLKDNGQDFIAVRPQAERCSARSLAKVGDGDEADSISGSKDCPEASGSGLVLPTRLPELLQKLNPHLLALKTLPLDRPVERVDLSPRALLSAHRFDLAAKLLYARHRKLGVESVWAAHVYEEHIRAFSKGSCREGDGIKSGIESYVNAYHAVLDSVHATGLVSSLSLVPVDRQHIPIDGAHRVAAAIAADCPVPALKFDFQANHYGWRFFRDRGLAAPVLDAMALEFVHGRSDTHFLHLFPTAEGRDEEARAILSEFGTIVYEKSLRLTGEGPTLLVRELYSAEKWIGTWANQFAGARKDASIRFQGSDALRVFLFHCDDLSKAKAAKERIRTLYGQGNYSCHINDSHEETVRLARLYFSPASLHFLNHARPRYLQRFHRHIELYRNWLKEIGADPELFCIDGSASLAAYGLRDAQDLDVLHWQHVDFATAPQGINSHNPDAHHHTVATDAILFDPEHHFYYGGLKFIALPALRSMKAHRAEGKDLADVALIDSLSVSCVPAAAGVVDVTAKNASREALRIYYVPNGDDYHIAALLDRLYTTVKPFGCRDVQDYIERRILAYKTPDAGGRLWDEVVAMHPDLVYVESARNIDAAVLQRIRTELGIPVTMWFGDACVNDEFVQRILSYAPAVTHQVTVDRHVALAARKRGIHNVEFVPFFGYDHYFRPMDVPKSIDILFSGKSYHKSLKRYPFAVDRLAFVQRVNREFGAKLRVVGEDWETFGLANVHHGRVPEWDVNRLNNESRIVLAYDAAHVDGFTSCRTYHALLGRSFILLRKFPGIERLFINREHLVWFESEQEGISLLHHYLAHPEECDRIARSGYQHVRANGWMFSSVVRHLVHRGLGRHSRSFEEVFAPYSKALPQPADSASTAVLRSTHLETESKPAAAAAKPVSAAERKRRAVEDSLQRADRYFREGKLAEARQWLERVLDLDPSAVEVWVASGNLALQLGEHASAVQALEHAAKLRPGDAPIQSALAAAYVRVGRIDDFEKALAAAFALDPEDPSGTRLLADLNFQAGRWVEAARGYHHLVRLHPNDVSLLLPLGVCFAKLDDRDTACTVFEEVLHRDPTNGIARENLKALGGVPKTTPSSAPAAAVTVAGPEGEMPASGMAVGQSRKPLITAIVSTYKSERYLPGCLEDLLAQTIADRLEIIVIDSGSPENERAVVESFQARHAGIRYVRTERETIYAAWNRAIHLATAPYLTSANADDRHRPDALEKLVKALEAHPGCALAYADCAVCETVHPDFGYTEIRGYYRWPDFDPVLLFRGCYVGPQPVWRRSLHQRYGVFDPEYRSAGDYEFWLRMAATERFLHVPEVLGLHWYAESSLGHQNRDLTREESERAKSLRWPVRWGTRPTESFRTLQHIPAVERQRKRQAELTSRIEALEKENTRLKEELKVANSLTTPSLESSKPTILDRDGHLVDLAPNRVVSGTNAGGSHAGEALGGVGEDASTVPASSLLPTDQNAEAFQHLLTGFDRLRENRFEEAQAEVEKYRSKVDYQSLPRRDSREDGNPELSVIVVAHRTRHALLACLDSLASSSNPTHEVIVVDNGGNECIEEELRQRPILHVRPPVNVLPSEARNIGVAFARAPIVVFVDDDATVGENFLRSILAAFDAYEIVAMRGKVLPKSDHENNRRVRHYDLGDLPIVADINTEGNSAVRVDAWREVGGQDPVLFGGEGVEFSYRLHALFGPSAILYWPTSYILHDYADDESKLDRKTDRHQAARAYLEWKHPGILEHHGRLKLAPCTDDERYQRTLPLKPRGRAASTCEAASVDAGSVRVRPALAVAESPLAELRAGLSKRGWMAKFDSYAAKFKSLETRPGSDGLQVSVVVIAHEIRIDSIKVLRKLEEDQDGTFEVVYVLNGSRTVEAEKVRPFVDTLVTLTENTGAYFARNVGSVFARAPILFFLDDDAIPERGVVAAHREEFRRFDVIAVRGAILPKTENRLNDLAKHYHLGARRFPIHADIEGNTSYLAEPFFAVSGWDDEIVFGGGGIDLAFRLLRIDSDRRKQIYSPVPIVYHDYAANEEHLAKKAKKQTESRERLHRKHPHFESLRNGWRSFFGKENLILPKSSDPGSKASFAQNVSGGKVPDFHPLITVAIPTFNRARFLPQAVRSALDQTYPHIEIVIIDDGSTDGTDAVLRQFEDPRVRTFSKEHSGGPATRNRCIAEARGEYLVWLDSDDVLLADTLALYVAELCRDRSLDVLYGNLLVADEQLRVQEVWSYDDYHGWPEALLAESTIENRIPNGGTLVRKTCYDRFGGYDERFPRAHDYEFWTRLAPLANVRSVRTEVAIYRRHEDSLTKVTKPADTRHEANAVKHLLSRHPLQKLFPFCFPEGTPQAHGEARAWTIASLLMAKYGDIEAARGFARRSVEAAELGQNVDILRILDAIGGKSPASSRSKANGTDEFANLVETAKRHYAAGNIQLCAKACARLSEIRPEAPETLLLTALSLRRWGVAGDAQTAFQCLVRRQCASSYVDAWLEAEPMRGLTSGDAGKPDEAARNPIEATASRFLSAISGFFAPEVIPIDAVRLTLRYVADAAAADDVRAFLNTRLHGQTPVFFAILGMAPEVLSAADDQETREALARVRAALETQVPPSQTRQPGYSFCIITGGTRPEKVQRQIESIHALGLDTYEIWVGGDVSQVPDSVRKVDLTAAAQSGRLGKMRNALGRLAVYDHLVVSDDDMVFDPGFGAGLKRFGEGYDFMAVKILNPDGSRFWDWSTTGGIKGSVLLDYWESDPHTYVTGGICVLKTGVLDRVQWDDLRGFYQREDVDFSTRARAAGFEVRYNAFCSVVHDDDRYSRVGRVVYRIENLLQEALEHRNCRSREELTSMLEAALRMAGNHPDRQQAVEQAAQQIGLPMPVPTVAPVNAPERAKRPMTEAASPVAVASRNGEPPATAFSASAKIEEAEPSSVTGAASAETLLVDWVGTFVDHGSLSHVNRELTGALSRLPGFSIQPVGPGAGSSDRLRGVQWSPARSLVATPSKRPAVTVRHAWPPNWAKPRSGALVVIQPWEFGALPKSWVRDLARVDEVWVPSQYVRRLYTDAGIPGSKVVVIPNGIDPERFHPGAPPRPLATAKRFKFLFVGGTIHRKGPDVLLKAYLSRFTAADDVCLVIKDFGGKSVYAGQTFEQAIRAAQARPNAPEILYLSEEWAPGDLPGLYTACDCLVHPYRGEGFGLPVLEAMACGLPVVVTEGGATDDFATESFAYRIPSSRKEFGNRVGDFPLSGTGWLLEPDAEALKARLGWVVEHRDDARAIGRAASQHVLERWTWEKSAQLAADRIRVLSNRTQSPGSPSPGRPGASAAIQLPACARLGHLGPAYEFLKNRKLREAWEATIAALDQRPFHPEAFLLLAEIARVAGDSDNARRCAQHARDLVPSWKPAKRFQQEKLKGHAQLPWLDLPALLTDGDRARKPRVSVCLIVRNEERFLPQCLASIRNLAHQIVVVDTGSTDRTIEVAREYGAEVHTFTWCDDFSAARNAALEYARGDWVLMLDADEELPADQHVRLLEDVKRAGVLGFRMPLVNVGAEADGTSYVPRLYRNAPGLFYVSRIHEQVFSSLLVRAEEWGLETALGTSQLKHYGYSKELVHDRRKVERNLRLLREAVTEFPDDANLHMNLGLEFHRSGDADAGLEEYERAFQALAASPEQQRVPELRETLLTQYAAHLMKAHRYTDIIRILRSPVALAYERTASLHFALGLAFLRTEQVSAAAEEMKECLAKRHLPTVSPINPEIRRAGPYHCLALCLARSERHAEAENAFIAALRDEPSSRAVRLDLARHLRAQKRNVDAIKVLHELIDGGRADAEVWRLGGEIALADPGLLEFAVDWTREALRHQPEQGVLAGQHGEALLLNGEPAAALSVFQAAADSGETSHRAARCLCELALGRSLTPVAPGDESAISTQFIRWFQRLAASNRNGVLHEVIEHIDALARVLPSAAGSLRAALTEAS